MRELPVSGGCRKAGRLIKVGMSVRCSSFMSEGGIFLGVDLSKANLAGKAVTVVARGDRQVTLESTAQSFLIRETANAGDLLYVA